MRKTLVGVLASHDSSDKNHALAGLFTSGAQRHADVLKKFGSYLPAGRTLAYSRARPR